MGGGTILDLGVYTIQLAQFVFGSEPISITAKGTVNEDGVDVETEVEMKYACGGVARFKTSALKELENKANVRGSKSFMTVSESTDKINLASNRFAI
jgi:dihydrodiol dehydrogenase / D-xylose 1-dehydrogenase (NADP)